MAFSKISTLEGVFEKVRFWWTFSPDRRVDGRANGTESLPLQTKTDTCGRKTKLEEKNLPFQTKTDTYGWKTKPKGKISLLKQKRIRVDERLIRRGKSPFETKSDTSGRKTRLEGKISLFKQKRILVDRAEVVSIEFIHHDPIYSMVQILLTLSTKFWWLPPAFPASITIEIFLLFCLFVCFFFSWNFGDSLSSILF